MPRNKNLKHSNKAPTLANEKPIRMSSYSIQDLAKLTGIKPHTIRMWEKRYGVIQPSRTHTNIRIYCDQDLRKLLNLSILTKNGYKISKIAVLSEKELAEKVIELTQTANNSSNEIDTLVIAMMEMNEDKFERALSRAIFKFGFTKTFTDIIHPFFDKVGTLWQIGTISPAQEHFISSLIRQKLIVAIDSLDVTITESSKTFLLFLHEEEMHELGLLFFYYIIKKAGHRVIYVGTQVPVNDLELVNTQNHIDFGLTAFTAPIDDHRLNAYLKKLVGIFKGKTIFVTGLEKSENIEVPQGIRSLRNGQEFMYILDEL